MTAIFQTTHFQIRFSEWKYINFDEDFAVIFPMGPINNIPELIEVMAWRRPADKPLSEPLMVRLSTYICVTRTHWVIWH